MSNTATVYAVGLEDDRDLLLAAVLEEALDIVSAQLGERATATVMDGAFGLVQPSPPNGQSSVAFAWSVTSDWITVEHPVYGLRSKVRFDEGNVVEGVADAVLELVQSTRGAIKKRSAQCEQSRTASLLVS